MHAERESCFGGTWEEATKVLQDIRSATAEILQHQDRQNSGEASHINSFTLFHGRRKRAGLLATL